MHFTDGEHRFYNDFNTSNSKDLLGFSRQLGKTCSLVVANFTDQQQTATFDFPRSGKYVEQIKGKQNLTGVFAGLAQTPSVASNYGCIWTIT